MSWQDEVEYGTWIVAGLIVLGLVIFYAGTAMGWW